MLLGNLRAGPKQGILIRILELHTLGLHNKVNIRKRLLTSINCKETLINYEKYVYKNEVNIIIAR
jgi:hypothetical protein